MERQRRKLFTVGEKLKEEDAKALEIQQGTTQGKNSFPAKKENMQRGGGG